VYWTWICGYPISFFLHFLAQVFLWVRCPSCHRTISVKTWNETQSTEPNHCLGLISSSSTITLRNEGVLLPLCQLSQRQYQKDTAQQRVYNKTHYLSVKLFKGSNLSRVLILATISVSDNWLFLTHPTVCLVGICKVLLSLQWVLKVITAFVGFILSQQQTMVCHLTYTCLTYTDQLFLAHTRRFETSWSEVRLTTQHLTTPSDIKNSRNYTTTHNYDNHFIHKLENRINL